MLKIGKTIKKYELAPNLFWFFNAKTLYFNHNLIKLTRNEINFLELLIVNQNKVFSDYEIINNVWRSVEKTSSYSVKNLIRNLRKKLPYQIIENHYSIGYKLISYERVTQKRIDFLENLKEISKVMQQTKTSKELIKNVLDKTLEIFDCDRVFLLYPLKVDAKSFTIPYEANKPKYSSAFAVNIKIEMNEKQSLFFKSILESKKPYYFNKLTLSDIKSYNGVKSALVWKIKPLIDNYWGFGMHQCSYERIWNEDEIELFKEIASRLEDALSILLLYEQTKLSRDNYQNINNEILQELNEKNQKLIKTNLELENKIDELKELQILFIKNAKLNIINELMDNIAHQWRQPLTVISMGSMGIKLKLKSLGINDENINKTLSLIGDETQYLSEIINKFNNFFQENNEKEFFYLSKIIIDTTSLFQDSFEFDKINLSIEINRDFKINSYLNELQQILYYILTNAKEALLQTDKQDKNIKVTLTQDEKNLIIKICDNGIGIKKEIIDRIYEPYFTTKFSKRGVGLSLYICKVLIETHFSGKLLIESEKDKTEFIIKLIKD